MTDREGPKVLYIIDSLSSAGAEQSLVSMAPHLLSLGVDLEVAYLLERPGLLSNLQAVGVVTHPVTAPKSRLGRVLALRRLIQARRPDLVHTTLFEADIAGRLAARLAGVPSVSSLVNVAYGKAQQRPPGVSLIKMHTACRADRFTARFPVRFHAITEHVAQTMSTTLSIPRSIIDIIPRGRDSRTLGEASPERRARVRTQLGFAPDTEIILAAARHEYQKGLDLLLSALPMVLTSYPGTTLLMAGREGNETRLLRKQIVALGLRDRVTILGMRGDVPDLLVASDVLVVPSRWEGFGGILVEALALGTPIVATDLPAVREVTRGLALYSDYGRPESIAQAIISVLRNPVQYANQALAGRNLYESTYTAESIANSMYLFYRRAHSRLLRERSRKSCPRGLRADAVDRRGM